jgi:hypothetical protein
MYIFATCDLRFVQRLLEHQTPNLLVRPAFAGGMLNHQRFRWNVQLNSLGAVGFLEQNSPFLSWCMLAGLLLLILPWRSEAVVVESC